VAEFFQAIEAGETLAALLDGCTQTTARTEEIIAGLPDLDGSHPLPEAPWFEPGACWTARRVLLHTIGETAQHARRADIAGWRWRPPSSSTPTVLTVVPDWRNDTPNDELMEASGCGWPLVRSCALE
jgi:hypothetical protein